jgi:hypothetical protein
MTDAKHRDPASRVGRYCDRCTLVDDHPRHTHALADGTTVDWHFDCCLCETCAAVLKYAGDLRGLELVDHIVNGGVDHLAYNAADFEVPDSPEGLEA